MNAMTELDRVLGEWLDEGPSRAPDRPIDIAMEHARSHPRRRDPFAFLRPDPMAARSRGFGARPIMVLAVLGLILAAVVAVGVGSEKKPAVVVPSPSAPPTSISPSPAPLGTIELLDELGTGATVEIDDASGLVIAAESARVGDRGPDPNAPEPASGVLVQNQDASTLRLSWGGGGCPTAYQLTIDETARSMRIVGAPCGGDAIGVGRVLLLHFATPVDASTVEASLQE
jgi:hypothetical protein